MSIKQKLSDIALLVKTQRKYKWIGGILIASILFLVLSESGQQRPSRTPRVTPRSQKSETLANREAYNDIVAAMEGKLNDLNKSLADNIKKDAEARERLENYEERTAEIFKKILERISENEASRNQQMSSVASEQLPGAEPVDIGPSEVAAALPPSDSLESFGDMSLKEAPPAPPEEPGKVAFIGAGDSVTVKLLAGVRAPTDGTPYPVLFKLVSDIQGPDGSALPLGEARLIGAAQGSLTDSRVLFRITKLNIRLPDGRRKVIDVDGWVVGEDGLRGMQGIPIDPIGKGIAAGGMIGALAAVGEGLARSTTEVTQDAFGNTTEIISDDLGKYAAGKGMSGFAKEWGKIVSERVRQLVPHIEVYSGREGTAVFAQSVAIRGLYETLEDEDNVYAALE